MITDHFKTDHLEKLFDMGWRTVPFADNVLTIDYRDRGEHWKGWITRMTPEEYRVTTMRLLTKEKAYAVIRVPDFGGFLETEMKRTEPEG